MINFLKKMKFAFTILFLFIASQSFSQEVNFEITNSVYSITDNTLSMDITIENTTKDTIFLVSLNEYIQNPRLKDLSSNIYRFNYYRGNECLNCNYLENNENSQWFRNFSPEYLTVIPPNEKLQSFILIEYKYESFKKRANNMYEISYDFNKNSYSESGDPAVYALLEKLSEVKFSKIVDVKVIN